MKNHKSITELFEYLHKFDYGFIHNGKKVINPKEKDWFNYRTLSIEEMDKYNVGVCWDTTYYVYQYLKSSGFRFTESYYMESNDERKSTHTFTYFYNTLTQKHCIVECSWYGHYGIHEYKDRDTAIDDYFKLFKQYNPSNKYIVFKYTPPAPGLTPEQYMGAVWTTGDIYKTVGYNKKDIIEVIKNHYNNIDILTEATIPKTKRKKMEDLIYRVFDALDPSGVNTARYKKLFQPMSDNQFETFFKNLFSDDNLYLNLDIVEYERDLKLDNVEKAAKVLNLPLFEHVMMPFINDDKVNPIVTKIRVPVGYIHLKPMQQLVSKKNTTSTSIGERSSLTGQVTGKDKNARDSDTENISMITIGAEESLKELLGPRADDQVALNQMLNSIKTKGYVSQKDIKTELKNKTSLNTVDVFLMGMGFKSDLVTDGLLLNKTVK